MNKYVDFVNVEEAIDLITNKSKVVKPLVAFTFDDGFEDCYTQIAPVLSDFNTNALFFINPGYVEGNNEYIKDYNERIALTDSKKPMSYEMLKNLNNNGFVIGNHTYNHIRLSDFDDIMKEVLDSKHKLEEILEISCDYFAWPYGQIKDIKEEQVDFLLKHHKYIFSGCNYTKYHSFSNSKVLNRRHFEGDWPISHLNYFLSKNKQY